MEAIAPIGINLGYLVLQIVNFIVLMLLLNFALVGPVGRMLRDRRERIAEGVNNARRAEEALANAESDKEKILSEARSEAQQIINEARSRAEAAAKQVAADADSAAQRTRQQAEEEASASRDRALSDMRDQIVSLSMAAANHILGTNLSEKDQRKSVDEFFTTLPEGAKGLGDSFVVVTAIPLNDKEVARFQKELGTKDVTFLTDPGILGGVIVRSGGQQIDGSFATQLSQMRGALV